MNNFTLTGNGQSYRIPSLFAAGVLATGMIHAPIRLGGLAELAQENVGRNVPYTAVQWSDTAAVGGQIIVSIPERSFEAEMASFYSRLLSAQRPLGEEFQAVLTENLWDLYAD
ncbi:hypothetical protein FAZ69_23360 [Trinickia terrae]|uniref:Uncharacterized protein n=1 Tax=Trinickia terrae TaxID=2571161 RepID=A0A4U1HSQ3_9BURK|nr:hypothetical protein [Trinickia terrae]TKC83433.1 hypothetical protein FAZ69_23360 [Trinickia terrae]